MEVFTFLAKKKASQPNTSGHSAFKKILKNDKKRQFVNAKGVRIAKFNLS